MSIDLEKSNVDTYEHHHARPSSSNGAAYRPAPVYLRQIANPGPLGLFSFASTTLILSLINAQARGVTVPNIIVGVALATGGIAQFTAGLFEFVCGNTFGATAFTSYGTFWMAFALIYVPGTGIIDAYSGAAASELHNAVGFFLMTWFIFTFFMLMASLRATFALASLFFTLMLTFMLLMIGEFTQNTSCIKAGGYMGIITSALGYYSAGSGLITPQSSYFVLPVGDLPKRT